MKNQEQEGNLMSDQGQMQKILIVVDMQNDFIDGSLGTREAAAAADRAAERIKKFNGSIIVTLDTHYQNYLHTAEGKKLPVEHCIYKTYGWRLHEKILNALRGKVYKTVEKETFGSPKLADEIRKLAGSGNVELEMLGLCTDICVVSNALILKAAFPEARLAVNASCCAGVTPQLHLAALQVMSSCQIDIIGEDGNEEAKG